MLFRDLVSIIPKLPSRTSVQAKSYTKMSSTVEQVTSKLFARTPLPPLEPGKKVYAEELIYEISNLPIHKFAIAALHLANDDIEHAHLIAQISEGDPTADLLHATLHRREGDYWNSKYWYSHITSHPLVPSVKSAKDFVDACENTVKGGMPGETVNEDELKLRQWDELKALVQWTLENCK